MRLRNVRGSMEAIEQSRFVIQEPKSLRGQWKEHFINQNPIHLEIGTGKGRFLMDLARMHPEINFIGVEKYSSVLIRAIQKCEQDELPNICFLRMDAEELPEVFEPGEVEQIYLNFSDPWPKDRHSKRRLTSRQFLERYTHFLKPEGLLTFKTDNVALFDFSLEELEEAPAWTLLAMTRDLHHSEYIDGNVMTEYEERFSSMGNPIHMMRIRYQPTTMS